MCQVYAEIRPERALPVLLIHVLQEDLFDVDAAEPADKGRKQKDQERNDQDRRDGKDHEDQHEQRLERMGGHQQKAQPDRFQRPALKAGAVGKQILCPGADNRHEAKDHPVKVAEGLPLLQHVAENQGVEEEQDERRQNDDPATGGALEALLESFPEGAPEIALSPADLAVYRRVQRGGGSTDRDHRQAEHQPEHAQKQAVGNSGQAAHDGVVDVEILFHGASSLIVNSYVLSDR